MKKPRTKVPARRKFKEQLAAYSTLSRAAGVAAVVTTAAATLGTAPAADAQVVNLTAASFGVTGATDLAARITHVLFGTGNLGASRLVGAGPVQFSMRAWQVNSRYALAGTFRAAAGVGLYPGGNLQFAVHPGGSNLQRIGSGPGNPINGLAWGDTAFGLRTHGDNLGNFVAGQNLTGDFFSSVIPGVSGYIGFRVETAGHAFQYGWLRVNIEAQIFNGNRPSGISLVEYGDGIFGAFNQTPGGAIYAGEVAIPEPASLPIGLGLFALGAVGVREFRRRRQQAA